MRLMRVMCSGRVDISHVFRSFSKGMDGVFIGGCHFNECNYITHGNFHALNMVLLAKKVMERVGLNPERVRIRVMSGAEGALYAEHVNSFIDKVYDLGPIGEAEGIAPDELKTKLDGVLKNLPYIKLMLNEKLGARQDKPDPEGGSDYFTKEEIDNLFDRKISYYIDPTKCQACMTCARRCPENAVISEKAKVHIIDQENCIRCGNCMAGCPPRFAAISKLEAGAPVPPPPPEDQRAVVRKAKENAS